MFHILNPFIKKAFQGITISLLFVVLLPQESIAKALQDLPPRVLKNRLETRKLRGTISIIVASDRKRAESGEIAAEILKREGFTIKDLVVVKNLGISKPLGKMVADPDIDAILCIGGTGISPRDQTIEAIQPFIQRELPAFGELLRRYTDDTWSSHKEAVGLLALDTRATAGVTRNGKIIFAIPGSPDAAELAVQEIICPGLPTLLGQLRKKEDSLF